MSVKYGFEGQVALITGAANGFGLAVAQRLADEGARLVLVDRDADGLKAAAEKLGGLAVDAHGRIDLFFNNAGIEGRMAPMTELSVADFDRVWAVNARGVFMGLRAVLKVMKPQGSGVIVNTASMAAIKGAATFSPYIASKHAVLGLTKSAALEGAPYGIRINCVAPGHFDTRMGRDLTHQINPDDPDGVFRAVSESVPYGKRYGTAAEVANVVLWLLSDQAEYVSGSLHLIDGALNAG
jgi:3alpha(or 20beta)-hydroxysteroid dehydrogenase